MKKLSVIAVLFLAFSAGLVSCGAHGNDPGHAYMPDMYYSRAFETYGYNDVTGEYDTLKARGIFYNAMPVQGTVARGDMLPHHYPAGASDSDRLKEANTFKNPLDSMAITPVAMKEAERLYLVNCAICHGTALDGNGPLFASGAYPVAPKNLTAPDAKAFTDGHYYFVMTFGKGMMGSYASQLTSIQRWWVIKYIRSKQATTGGGTGASKDSTATANTATASKSTDSASKK